jgi:uncharacterized membrane protein (DUF441 family)
MIGDAIMANRIILLCLIGISAFAKNKPLLIGGIIVFLLSFLSKYYISKLDKNIFLNGGLTLLMIWMLMPLIQSGNESSFINVRNYLNLEGLVAVLSGLFVVIVAARGLDLLNNNISVLTGVLVGSIIGVTFFGGIPVGMMTGSGIAYLIIKLVKGLL